MSSEIKKFYPNDIVYRYDKKKRINFGVVIDNWETSADSEDSYSLQKGQVKVWWFNFSRKAVVKENKLKLLSRSIIPGDSIYRSNGDDIQKGYCREAVQIATVQIIGTDKIIENIPSARLVPISPYVNNDAICLEEKFGRIQNVDQKITMRSKCGSVVKFFSSLNHDIEDYYLIKLNKGICEYFYPSQEVMCTPINLIQPNWVCHSKQMKRNMNTRQRFIIQNVELVDIEVAWYEAPSNIEIRNISGKEKHNLKIAQSIEKTHLMDLTERRMFKLSSADKLITKKDWLRKQCSFYQTETFKIDHSKSNCNKKNSKGQTNRSSLMLNLPRLHARDENDDEWWTEEAEDELLANVVSDVSICSTSSTGKTSVCYFPPKLKDFVPGNTLPVEIMCMDSKVTVVWQDGTEEVNLPTNQLFYSLSLGDHEFFPGEFVVEEDRPEDEYGVIQFVNESERTAKVKWFKYNVTSEILMEINEKSVYDLKNHPKFSFHPGTIVKRFPVEKDKIGTVIDSYPQGHVEVKWIDGSRENCSPHSLELIPDSVDYEMPLDDNDSTQIMSWETESMESCDADLNDERTLQNIAARLDFIRGRIIYLKEVITLHSIQENFSHLKELLTVYDNCSYLDKLLETSFFSLKSKHFQALLTLVKEKAQLFGVELHGRLFSNVECHANRALKSLEKENINKLVKLENNLHAQIGNSKETEEQTTPSTPESELYMPLQNNICVELLSMMKARMDLAYAEIISRIDGSEALTVMTKASEKVATSSSTTPMPSLPVTPEDSFSLFSLSTIENESFAIIDDVPFTHHFANSTFEPWDKMKFYRTVEKEYKLLKDSLPPGLWVRSYQNRVDLLSFLIAGPAKTPYEGGLFLFDVQLTQDYPKSPPIVHYVSYTAERMNPNLYVEGKVCVSLLGTWVGKGTEMWGPKSTLLQLIVSIQGLILVSEPFYNEAGYEKMVESLQGMENSRNYNELVILKLVQSMTEMLRYPPEPFQQEILEHFSKNGEKLAERLQNWCEDNQDFPKPEFPLLPVSRGLKLSLTTALTSFKEILSKIVSVSDDKEIVNP